MSDSSQCRVTVQSLGQNCLGSRTDTLLDSILAAGIDYPHGCTTGLCGLCKSRLISGDVEDLDYFDSALRASERAAQLILPCCALPLSDCTITPVRHDAHMPVVREMAGQVRQLNAVTPDIMHLVIELPDAASAEFLPGQYASLTFGTCPPRDFSMASLPGARALEFLIRRVPDGEVTAYVFRSLQVGDIVTIKGPYGLAYLRESHTGGILAVAGGTGLAPVLSIVAAALDRGMSQEIIVFLGTRERIGAVLESRLQALTAHRNVTIHMSTSREKTDAFRFGVVSEIVAAGFKEKNLTDWHAYIAGSPRMVNATAAALDALGLPGENCFVDPFLTQADRLPLSAPAPR